MPPKAIGPYQIRSILGAGGIGCVYRALDRRTGEEVALKLLSSGPALDAVAARRMAREFEALYELSHPNVVRVFDTGVHRGYPYLTMELIEGLTLREYLTPDRHGRPRMTGGRRRLPLEDSESFDASDLDDDSEETSFHERPVEADPFEGEPEGADPYEDEEEEDDADGAFGIDRLGEEPDTDPSLLRGAHASGRGPEALRRLADAIDEPFTEDEDYAAPPEAGRRSPTKVGHTHTPHAADLDELSSPERIALLKDALLQICEALAYIHGRGMVHRDLKPSNIMVDDDRRVKLMDFGLAKYLAEDSSVTAAGRIVGTYRYMAPEQLLGERLDGRADLYSLGVMLYELLAGRPPFDATSPLEMAQKVLEAEALPLLAVVPNCDEVLARVAHRLMHKDPGERFQTAEEVYEALAE